MNRFSFAAPVVRGSGAPSLAATRANAGRPVRRQANFLITINTNIAPRTQTETNRLHSDLDRALTAVFTSNDTLGGIIRFRDSPRNLSLITNIEPVDIGYEVGTERGMFHAHALLTIDHVVPGKGIHLDPKRFLNAVLRNVSIPELQGRNMYVNIKGFPSLASARGYIYKNASSLSAAQMAALVRGWLSCARWR